MTDWKILGSIISGMVALFVFVARHVTNDKKHCTSEKMVYADVCEERGKTNAMSHQNLKDGIDSAIVRSNEQHAELKADMRNGFHEIKSLIEKALCLVVILAICGCTTYHAEVPIPNSDKIATLDMTYFLQKKDIKKFKINLVTSEIILENFGSDTSEVVQTLIDKFP